MTTLEQYAAFLAARWDEIEQVAQGAEHFDGPRTLSWKRAGRRAHHFSNGRREDYESVAAGDWDRILIARDDGEVARHIALHDPALVLEDLAAKRAILNYLSDTDEDYDSPHLLNAFQDLAIKLAEPFRSHPDHPAN